MPRAASMSSGDVTLTWHEASGSVKRADIEFPRQLQASSLPPQIIAHAVWLYFRFPLSLRLVEEMLLERGIVVSYETIRRWGRKFGPQYACRLRRKRPSRNDVWHLDEVVVMIAGKRHWLWRAVDQDGYVLDEIIQRRRDTNAAKRLLVKLLKKQDCAPKRMITDKFGHKGLNNRAENSHQPTRRREKIMKRFKSARQLQRFVSIHDPIANLFHFPRHALSSSDHRDLRSAAMATWHEITHIAAA